MTEEDDMRRGRPQLGSDLVEKLDADGATTNRVRLILDSISGTVSTTEAAARLGLSESAFCKLRRRCLDGMAAAAAGGVPGRPPKPPPEITPETAAAMRDEIEELKWQLEGAKLREQIALLGAGVDPKVGKKGRKKQGAQRRRKKEEQKWKRTRRG